MSARDNVAVLGQELGDVRLAVWTRVQTRWWGQLIPGANRTHPAVMNQCDPTVPAEMKRT
jgi:hypothetical protein